MRTLHIKFAQYSCRQPKPLRAGGSRPVKVVRQACRAQTSDRVVAAIEAELFKTSLRPLKCTYEIVDGTLQLTVVSEAFEGKSGKKREKLVMQALGEELAANDLVGLSVIAMTPGESAAALKKWC
ncbi:g9530 [Coccomyxa elongata]